MFDRVSQPNYKGHLSHIQFNQGPSTLRICSIMETQTMSRSEKLQLQSQQRLTFTHHAPQDFF